MDRSEKLGPETLLAIVEVQREESTMADVAIRKV